MNYLRTSIIVWLLGFATANAQSHPSFTGNSAWKIERLPPVDAPRSAEPKAMNARARLTLPDLEAMAAGENPAIGRAALAVEAARGNWLQVGLPPNPRVGGGQQQTGSRGRAEQDNVTFSQEVVLGGKLRLSREVAAKEVVRAERGLAVERARVETDVRTAFYTAIIAQRQVTVADELVRIAQLGLKFAEDANRADPTFRNDILEARIELRTAEIEARQSANRHLSAWRSLAAVVGHPALPVGQLEGNIEAVAAERDWDETLQRLQCQSPEVAAAVVQIERARAARRRAAVEPTPNVTVDTLFNYRDNGIGGDPDGGIQLSLPLPLWNRNQGGVRQAEAEIGMAERDYRRLHLGLQQRLAAVFERYSSARFRVLQYRDTILLDAQEALKITRDNYRDGQVDYDDLLTSQRTNAQANLEYLNALRELRIAEVEIQGYLLTDSLATP